MTRSVLNLLFFFTRPRYISRSICALRLGITQLHRNPSCCRGQMLQCTTLSQSNMEHGLWNVLYSTSARSPTNSRSLIARASRAGQAWQAALLAGDDDSNIGYHEKSGNRSAQCKYVCSHTVKEPLFGNCDTSVYSSSLHICKELAD